MFNRFKYRKFYFRSCLLKHHEINRNAYIGWYCATCGVLGNSLTDKEVITISNLFTRRMSNLTKEFSDGR